MTIKTLILLQKKIEYCQAKKKELHDKKLANWECDDETVFACVHWIEKYNFLEEELKKLRDECISTYPNMWMEELEQLTKENNELKHEIMEYYQIVNCGNCRYHNYDWYDDGDEFEVCDKGNDEQLIYKKFCKEWEQL